MPRKPSAETENRTLKAELNELKRKILSEKQLSERITRNLREANEEIIELRKAIVGLRDEKSALLRIAEMLSYRIKHEGEEEE